MDKSIKHFKDVINDIQLSEDGSSTLRGAVTFLKGHFGVAAAPNYYKAMSRLKMQFPNMEKDVMKAAIKDTYGIKDSPTAWTRNKVEELPSKGTLGVKAGIGATGVGVGAYGISKGKDAINSFTEPKMVFTPDEKNQLQKTITYLSKYENSDPKIKEFVNTLRTLVKN
jgi:hypothetical protein